MHGRGGRLWHRLCRCWGGRRRRLPVPSGASKRRCARPRACGWRTGLPGQPRHGDRPLWQDKGRRRDGDGCPSARPRGGEGARDLPVGHQQRPVLGRSCGRGCGPQGHRVQRRPSGGRLGSSGAGHRHRCHWRRHRARHWRGNCGSAHRQRPGGSLRTHSGPADLWPLRPRLRDGLRRHRPLRRCGHWRCGWLGWRCCGGLLPERGGPRRAPAARQGWGPRAGQLLRWRHGWHRLT
mmetsp:Transcript_101940/g.263463  ORF Transcript_101940/g.263463 Transcript_101940/m.263463 type:complete len:236 (+) Transcript_101940:620-1327(+)